MRRELEHTRCSHQTAIGGRASNQLLLMLIPRGMRNKDHSAPIDHLKVFHYTIPTDSLESDGTLHWDHTGLVISIVYGGGKQGLGYTYAGSETAAIIHRMLADVVQGCDAMSPVLAYMAMWNKVRNVGRPGICSMAISAVDCAIWDLKARLLDVPLASLLGQVRRAVHAYGSGGFTSYTDRQLTDQLGGWAAQGFGAVKMKIGRDPQRDRERVEVARRAIGPDTRLYVDANGSYSPRHALAQMTMLAEHDVRWFEEPVTSDNREGLRFVREHVAPEIDIAAGEYGYTPFYFREMLEDRAVDVLQADITRCGGITGFMQVADLCAAFNVPLSSHTAPAQHIHVACAAVPFTEMEYFHDHVRIERMFFDGFPRLARGVLEPDWSSPGNGFELREIDARKFAA
jgi:L-alanine-DL-glutamate epimerase-like enolase superfamily enzyme